MRGAPLAWKVLPGKGARVDRHRYRKIGQSILMAFTERPRTGSLGTRRQEVWGI